MSRVGDHADRSLPLLLSFRLRPLAAAARAHTVNSVFPELPASSNHPLSDPLGASVADSPPRTPESGTAPPPSNRSRMDVPTPLNHFSALLDATKEVARDVAAVHAQDVDDKARFPVESIAALRRIGALSAPVPRELGGLGCSLAELSTLSATVAAACGASGMVLAMHYIQVACLARHAQSSANLQDYLTRIVDRQLLLASMTSEQGTSGDTRTSICAVERDGERFALDKNATTGSYCAHADAILVTARRDDHAAGSDQVLVLVDRDDAVLTQTTDWNTLGMRGTCSPGFKLESAGHAWQILPVPFADISAQTMVPYSHVLWAALWSGIGSDAISRAAQFVRAQARQQPGQTPPTAVQLARVWADLQTMRAHWRAIADEVDLLDLTPNGHLELLGMGWALKLNSLKTSASEAAPRIVHQCLQILGIPGYKNEGPLSVGRHYRDVLSASLMISNERIIAKSAAMLTVLKEE